ncbi:MAG: hypothetical protein H5U05_09375 [Candidatus Aminicenantes bacterium]|nr:hypothetical protein [Candidatus Aminicenantes bacterium]
MTILYEKIARDKELLTTERISKYNKWTEDAEKARKTSHSLEATDNQYDKAEELITFYTFAPLEHEKTPEQVKLETIQEILRCVNINETLKEATLHFERDLEPPLEYLEWLKAEVIYHPIRYIREQAQERIKSEEQLEGPTQVDAVIDTDRFLILIEVKFTSDISPSTKFGLIRNQIARLIDVGISKVKKMQNNKKDAKLIVLCCTPHDLFHKRSRFYYYKMQEYSDPLKTIQDIPWRTLYEINKSLEKVAWISLEKIIEIIYRNTREYLNPDEFKEAAEFFIERKLWSFPE